MLLLLGSSAPSGGGGGWTGVLLLLGVGQSTTVECWVENDPSWVSVSPEWIENVCNTDETPVTPTGGHHPLGRHIVVLASKDDEDALFMVKVL